MLLRDVKYAVSAVTMALMLPSSLLAQNYPSEAVRMIVPFATGGATDSASRVLAEALSKDLGQQFVVENIGGAAGGIGYATAAKADPDGSTILMGFSSTSTCSPHLYSNLTWDPVKDFRPIGTFGLFGSALIVHPNVPANTFEEFVTYLKAHPGELNFGSSGMGSNTHIVTELFQLETGTQMTHVPYKGSGDLMSDLLAGNIEVAFAGFPSFQKHIRTGALKVLATARPQRELTAPDIPTMIEMGYPGIGTESWLALFVPTGTPDDVVKVLSDALERVTKSEAYLSGLSAAGVDPGYSTPAQLAERIEKESTICRDTVKRAGISLN